MVYHQKMLSFDGLPGQDQQSLYYLKKLGGFNYFGFNWGILFGNYRKKSKTLYKYISHEFKSIVVAVCGHCNVDEPLSFGYTRGT